MARKLETVLTAQDKTKAAFASVNRSIGNMKKGMAVVSVGVASLGVSFIAATKRSIALADSIDKTSRATGVGAEALQRWRFVATQAGGTTEKLDAALLKLNKRIGEARQNTGNLATVIKRYDEELYYNIKNTKNTEEALELIIEAMRNAKDAADEAAIGSAAFGREFKTFANIAKMEKKEVDALSKSLKNIISQKAIDSGVALVDALDKIQKEFDAGLANSILENASAMEDLARAAGEAVPKLFEAAVSLGEFFGLVEKPKLEKLQEQLAGVESRIEKITPIAEFFDMDPDWFPVRELIIARARAEDLRNEIEMIKKQSPIDVVVTLTQRRKLIRDAGSEFDEMFPGYAFYQENQKKLDEAKALAMAKRREAIDKEAAALRLAQDPLFAYNEERQRLNDLSIEFPEHSDVFRTALANLEYDFISASDTLEGSFVRAFEAMEQGFENIDYLSGDIFGQIGDLAKNAVNQIIAEFMRTQILGPLLQGVFGGIFGGGGGFLGGLFGGARAEGGPVSGGTPYLVGEKGPEIFVPNSSGGIIPNNRMPSNDNGMTIIQHLHFDVGLESVEAKIREAEPRISRVAAAGVRDAQQRTGGAYI